MFGAYQAGVWKALQPVFRPDVVIGCSVGSINGWAIASGIPGDELIRTWLDPRTATLMTPRASWRPRAPALPPAPPAPKPAPPLARPAYRDPHDSARVVAALARRIRPRAAPGNDPGTRFHLHAAGRSEE